MRVHGFPSATRDRYYIQCTADEDILRYWAQELQVHAAVPTTA